MEQQWSSLDSHWAALQKRMLLDNTAALAGSDPRSGKDV